VIDSGIYINIFSALGLLRADGKFDIDQRQQNDEKDPKSVHGVDLNQKNSIETSSQMRADEANTEEFI
jgi:hypothetical protein